MKVIANRDKIKNSLLLDINVSTVWHILHYEIQEFNLKINLKVVKLIYRRCVNDIRNEKARLYWLWTDTYSKFWRDFFILERNSTIYSSVAENCFTFYRKRFISRAPFWHNTCLNFPFSILLDTLQSA